MNIRKIIRALYIGVIFQGVFFCSVNATELESQLNLTSNNAVVMDLGTGEIIYALNATDKVTMASTTKLMTGLLLSEHRNKEDLIPFTYEAMIQPSSSVYRDVIPSLKVGDKLLAEDVMKGLLLKSGNDMAVIIAEDIAGDQVSFSEMMDAKAISIGMKNTDFYTSNGLDSDNVLKGEKHYSTALDLALLGRASFEDEWVREVMSLDSSKIQDSNGVSYILENTNKNLGLNGCIGGKTGYTTKAGRCLVSIYERDGRLLVGVVLGGTNPGFFDDMNKIMDYSFSAEKKVFIGSGELDEIRVKYNLFGKFGPTREVVVPVKLKEDILIYDNEFNREHTTSKIEYLDVTPWDMDEDTVIGEIVVEEENKISKYSLYTTIDKGDLIRENMGTYGFCILVLIIVGALVIYILTKQKK